MLFQFLFSKKIFCQYYHIINTISNLLRFQRSFNLSYPDCLAKLKIDIWTFIIFPSWKIWVFGVSKLNEISSLGTFIVKNAPYRLFHLKYHYIELWKINLFVSFYMIFCSFSYLITFICINYQILIDSMILYFTSITIIIK